MYINAALVRIEVAQTKFQIDVKKTNRRQRNKKKRETHPKLVIVRSRHTLDSSPFCDQNIL